MNRYFIQWESILARMAWSMYRKQKSYGKVNAWKLLVLLLKTPRGTQASSCLHRAPEPFLSLLAISDTQNGFLPGLEGLSEFISYIPWFSLCKWRSYLPSPTMNSWVSTLDLQPPQLFWSFKYGNWLHTWALGPTYEFCNQPLLDFGLLCASGKIMRAPGAGSHHKGATLPCHGRPKAQETFSTAKSFLPEVASVGCLSQKWEN